MLPGPFEWLPALDQIIFSIWLVMSGTAQAEFCWLVCWARARRCYGAFHGHLSASACERMVFRMFSVGSCDTALPVFALRPLLVLWFALLASGEYLWRRLIIVFLSITRLFDGVFAARTDPEFAGFDSGAAPIAGQPQFAKPGSLSFHRCNSLVSLRVGAVLRPIGASRSGNGSGPLRVGLRGWHANGLGSQGTDLDVSLHCFILAVFVVAVCAYETDHDTADGFWIAGKTSHNQSTTT